MVCNCDDECLTAEINNAESSSEKELSELEQYWKAVKENPSDFTGWTYLLQFVEQEVCLTFICFAIWIISTIVLLTN